MMIDPTYLGEKAKEKNSVMIIKTNYKRLLIPVGLFGIGIIVHDEHLTK